MNTEGAADTFGIRRSVLGLRLVVGVKWRQDFKGGVGGVYWRSERLRVGPVGRDLRGVEVVEVVDFVLVVDMVG